MSAVVWENRPSLEQPVLITAFAGWNDAGDAATGAARYLAGHWRAKSFATIDPEDFFDFTNARPLVRLEGGVTRMIEWPTNRFSAAHGGPGSRDAVFLHGQEPQLRWRTFCDAIIDCARSLGVTTVISLGALLADVPHTRPTPITVNTGDGALLARLGLAPSRYEGPTGIVGVLHDACTRAGLASTSLWGAVPHYVGQTSSPKATLALVECTAEILDIAIPTTDLQIAANAYEQQVSEVVEEDEDVASYVHQLEESNDIDNIAHRGGADSLAAEAERFLRDTGHDD